MARPSTTSADAEPQIERIAEELANVRSALPAAWTRVAEPPPSYRSPVLGAPTSVGDHARLSGWPI
jgi:hypothetical protein